MPRFALTLAAIAPVVAVIVLSSAVATSVAVICLGVALALTGPGTAPSDPGYLARHQIRDVTATVVASAPLAVVADGVDLDAVLTEITALDGSIARAVASRHRARAARYAARRADLWAQYCAALDTTRSV